MSNKTMMFFMYSLTAFNAVYLYFCPNVITLIAILFTSYAAVGWAYLMGKKGD